jgi:alkanesulfonate monooxygenase SsuD/methylene tetrahydromethanopterin reductase-like flavin-dependent oxidoreductase (luciferase family)
MTVKISLFLELATPRPWTEHTEFDTFKHYLEAVEIADRAGMSTVWITEHHFLEEYCHASAPEIFLAAASQRTKQIRLGHGIVHMLPQVNHPARVAERIASLDVVSGGRVEFGTGEGSSVAELGGFQVDPGQKRAMWAESVQVATRCMAEAPFTGFQGQFVDMPPRLVVPQPVQKPHPPVWIACTRPATVEVAADLGIGALSFSILGPATSKAIRDGYYERFAERASPITPGINPNTMFLGGTLHCAETDEQAVAQVGPAAGFFAYGIAYYYVHGMHRPGQVDVWSEYLKSIGLAPPSPEILADEARRKEWEERAAAERAKAETLTAASNGIGSPESLRRFLRMWEETGTDELAFLLPPMDHELVLESLERLGKEVMPEFIDRHEAGARAREATRAELIEKAEARRTVRPPDLDPDYAYGGVPVSFDKSYEASEVADVMRRAAEMAAGSS